MAYTDDSKCAACGGDYEYRDNAKYCKSTGSYGCRCANCGSSWHTGVQPYAGVTINCPQCGDDKGFRH